MRELPAKAPAQKRAAADEADLLDARFDDEGAYGRMRGRRRIAFAHPRTDAFVEVALERRQRLLVGLVPGVIRRQCGRPEFITVELAQGFGRGRVGLRRGLDFILRQRGAGHGTRQQQAQHETTHTHHSLPSDHDAAHAAARR